MTALGKISQEKRPYASQTGPPAASKPRTAPVPGHKGLQPVKISHVLTSRFPYCLTGLRMLKLIYVRNWSRNSE